MIEIDWEFEKIKKYKENALRENIYNKENIKNVLTVEAKVL